MCLFHIMVTFLFLWKKVAHLTYSLNLITIKQVRILKYLTSHIHSTAKIIQPTNMYSFYSSQTCTVRRFWFQRSKNKSLNFKSQRLLNFWHLCLLGGWAVVSSTVTHVLERHIALLLWCIVTPAEEKSSLRLAIN